MMSTVQIKMAQVEQEVRAELRRDNSYMNLMDHSHFRSKLSDILNSPEIEEEHREFDEYAIWQFTDIPRAMFLSKCSINRVPMGDCYAENEQLQKELRAKGEQCDLYAGRFCNPKVRMWGKHCFCVQLMPNGEKYYYDRSNGEEKRLPLVIHLEKIEYSTSKRYVNGKKQNW